MTTPPPDRVLVVDDEPSVRNICRVALQRGGFSVDTASTAEEALEAFRREAFDLVVTDIFLGRRHGLELADELRSLRPACGVIVMTGMSTVERAVEALKTGACDFLEKPFAPSKLAGAARAAVDRKRREGSVERAKSEVLSRVSHELRTPVAVAMAACGIMKSRAADEEQLKLAEKAEQGLSRLKARVEEIVACATAAAAPRYDEADAAALLTEAAGLCAAEAGSRGVSVLLEAPAGLRLRCDAAKVRAALKELISNAVKFGPAGGEVLARAERAAGGIEFLVCDRGPGVPDGEREKIFESFLQREGTLTREAGGLGLGLSTVRRVAQAHGGFAALSSREGGGCVARLSLPASLEAPRP